MMKITVELLLDVEDDAEACDAMNEILREQQRIYTASSCLLDYQIVTHPEPTDGSEFDEHVSRQAA